MTAALSTPSGQQVVQNAANAISNTYYQIASQAMIENPGLIAFVAGQTATGRSLVDSGNAMADSYQSIFSDPCGAFASVFGDDNSTNPNVGKDLTDEEKNELGGIGSGAPGDQRMKMNGIRYSLQAHLRGKLKIHMVLLKMPPNIQKDLELVKTVQ